MNEGADVGLKVFFLINGLGTGGAEHSLAELLPWYATAGIHPVIVCLFRREEGVQESVEAAGFEVIFLEEAKLLGRVLEFRKLIRQHKPGLVHTTIFDSDVIGRLAALWTGVPVSSSIVNMSYEPERLADPRINRFRLWVVKVIDALTSRFLTRRLHAITYAVKGSVIKRLGVKAEKIDVVRRGRDPKKFRVPGRDERQAIRSRLGISADQIVLLNVGRQEYQKGQNSLLRAMRLVLDAGVSAVLLQAGRKGEASAELHDLVDELSLNGHVKFLGHRNDIVDLMAAADLFAFPSVYEGLGCSLIEAMAMHLPIISTDIEVIREVVEQDGNASLVPPGDDCSLAQAIVDLCNDGARREQMGLRGEEIFNERFTVKTSAEGMVKFLYRAAAC